MHDSPSQNRKKNNVELQKELGMFLSLGANLQPKNYGFYLIATSMAHKSLSNIWLGLACYSLTTSLALYPDSIYYVKGACITVYLQHAKHFFFLWLETSFLPPLAPEPGYIVPRLHYLHYGLTELA